MTFVDDAARLIADEAQRELLKIDDAARRLSVGRTMLYELMDAGEIDYVKVGRSRRIVKASLGAYIDRNRGRV